MGKSTLPTGRDERGRRPTSGLFYNYWIIMSFKVEIYWLKVRNKISILILEKFLSKNMSYRVRT
jgi:hypothetical protein